MIVVKVTFMLKVDTEKIWKLLKKDKQIQAELLKYMAEEQESLIKVKNNYFQQQEVVNALKEKKENLSHEINKIDEKITRSHAEISFLEIQKIIAERRLQKLKKLFYSSLSKKEKTRLLKRIKKKEEEIKEFENNQLQIQSSIKSYEKEKEFSISQKRSVNEELDSNLDQLEEYSRSVRIWQEQVDMKESRFYHAAFEKVTEHFKPCQDLVVPDLEETKKMTKEDAKKKANPIIIDNENILSSPDQIKVRKLTKEEKEKYRKAS